MRHGQQVINWMVDKNHIKLLNVITVESSSYYTMDISYLWFAIRKLYLTSFPVRGIASEELRTQTNISDIAKKNYNVIEF